jgi:hypothetical protein
VKANPQRRRPNRHIFSLREARGKLVKMGRARSGC